MLSYVGKKCMLGFSYQIMGMVLYTEDAQIRECNSTSKWRGEINAEEQDTGLGGEKRTLILLANLSLWILKPTQKFQVPKWGGKMWNPNC